MVKKKFKKNTTRKKIQFLYLVYSCMVVKPARSIHQFCYAFLLFPLIFLLYRFFYIANKSICSAHINTYILYKFHAKWYIIEITVCAPMYSPLTTNTKKSRASEKTTEWYRHFQNSNNQCFQFISHNFMVGKINQHECVV